MSKALSPIFFVCLCGLLFVFAFWFPVHGARQIFVAWPENPTAGAAFLLVGLAAITLPLSVFSAYFMWGQIGKLRDIYRCP